LILRGHPNDSSKFIPPEIQVIGLVVEALKQHSPEFNSTVQLSNISFQKAYFTAPCYGVNIHITTSEVETRFDVVIRANGAKTWNLYASGSVDMAKHSTIFEVIEPSSVTTISLPSENSCIFLLLIESNSIDINKNKTKKYFCLLTTV
jgi:hypothetical protein